MIYSLLQMDLQLAMVVTGTAIERQRASVAQRTCNLQICLEAH